MNNNPLKIAIVGGGASGVTAALFAAKQAADNHKDVRICIYDSADRLLKKILVTGNGRCNLSNTDVSVSHYFGETHLFSCIYDTFDASDTLSFFRDLGLLTVTDAAGRIYPRSFKAASVADVLLRALDHAGVETVLNTCITSLEKRNGGYILNGRFYADAVILSSGGMISANGKRAESVYQMLKSIGIAVTPLHPALTAFTVRDFTKSLKGIRSVGALRLIEKGKTVAKTQGEIQYTEYGISGIPAMQLSSYAARIGSDLPVYIEIDSLPETDDNSFISHFQHIRSLDAEMPLLLFLTGFMPKALAAYYVGECGLKQTQPLKNISPAFLSRILDCCKRKRYEVKGLRGFENAQVTSGGICGSELTDTLMLKKLPRVYACGELVDVDGDCGGYNLQWAWSSGAVAGNNCILEIL